MKILKAKMIERIQNRIADLGRELKNSQNAEAKQAIAIKAISAKRAAWLHRVLEQNPQAELSMQESSRYGDNGRSLTVSINPFSGVIPSDIAHDPCFQGRYSKRIEDDIERAAKDHTLIQMADGDTLSLQVKEMDRMQDYLK